MLRKESNMPLLSLHALAAARGDGLRPEFVDQTSCGGCRRHSFQIRSASGRKSLRTSKRRPGFEQAVPQDAVRLGQHYTGGCSYRPEKFCNRDVTC